MKKLRTGLVLTAMSVWESAVLGQTGMTLSMPPGTDVATRAAIVKVLQDLAVDSADVQAPAINEPFTGDTFAAAADAASNSGGILAPCKADINGDLLLTHADVLAFLGAFSGGGSTSDFNADGFLTFEDFDAFVQAFEAGCKFDEGPLFPCPLWATGASPLAVAIGDLDGDRRPDLVVANSGANTISVLRNIGNSTFATKVDYAVGSSPNSVVIGDLDGDRRPDLAVANSGSVSVLRNLGNGTFAAQVDFRTPLYSRSLAIGDLDGDTRPDIVTANGSYHDVSILRNLGFINFAERVDIRVGENPSSVAIADLDGDHRPDLAVAKTGDSLTVNGSVSILRNLGNGRFAPQVDYTTGFVPASIGAGDLDGDGRPDLTVANAFSDSVSVLRNLGNGNFAAKVDYSTATNPSFVAIGDIDADGQLDIAVACRESRAVSVLQNAGDGTFLEKVDYATGVNPQAIAIGDLNGDGRADLAVVHNSESLVSGASVGILQNLGNGTLAARVDFATGKGPVAVAIGDLNGDGHPDLAVANGFPYGGGDTISILKNMGTGTFADRVDYATGKGPSAVAIVDLDSDGRQDLAVANAGSNTLSVFRNISSRGGDVIFADKADYPTGAGPVAIAVGDLDLDGHPDLAVVNGSNNNVSIFRNLRNGSLTARLPLTTNGNARAVAIGDLDGDGRPDIAVANDPSNTVSVFRNLAKDSFAARVDYATGRYPAGVAIGDLDGDGRPELAVANSGSNTVSVLRNVGAGTFAAKIDYKVVDWPSSVAIRDLDGDGLLDLAVPNFYSRTLSVLLNVGTGQFAARLDYAVGRQPNSVAVGDFNGDGRLDLAVTNESSGEGGNCVSILLNQLGNRAPVGDE